MFAKKLHHNNVMIKNIQNTNMKPNKLICPYKQHGVQQTYATTISY